MLNEYEFVAIFLAAVAAGGVNALAGGGTLISFPVLTALGIPPVAANITNTIALCPGYFGGALAQSGDLKSQGKILIALIPASIMGGLAGGILLLNTGEKAFDEIIPYLILFASVLLALQSPLRKWLVKRGGKYSKGLLTRIWIVIPIIIAAIYGGYFGAGLSVIFLAVLGLVLDDSLTRLNAVKQVLSLSVNISAAIYFMFSDQVVWAAAVVMSIGALAGGALGGRIAGKIKPDTLRIFVVIIGVAVSIIYFIK